MNGRSPLIHPWTFRRGATPKAWAGSRLPALFPGMAGLGPKTGETVEVAGCEGVEAKVASGPAAGRTLRELIAELGWQAVTGVPGTEFPVILKLIDTAQPLSVQVHPSAGWKGPGSRGKNECWMVLDAGPEACIWQGKQPGLTDAEFWRLAVKGETDRAMVRRTVRRGDFIDNPSGLVHAIGPDIVLLELQEACPVTFRIWDWGGRSDPAAGGGGAVHKPRELHVAEARHHARTGLEPPPVRHVPKASGGMVLRDGPDFAWTSWRTVDRLELHRSFPRARVYTCLEGTVDVSAAGHDPVVLKAGDSVLIPAEIPSVAMTIEDGGWLMEAVIGGINPQAESPR